MNTVKIVLRGFIYGVLVGICALFLALAVTWMVLIMTHNQVAGWFSFVTSFIAIFAWGIWPQR